MWEEESGSMAWRSRMGARARRDVDERSARGVEERSGARAAWRRMRGEGEECARRGV